MTQYFGKYRGKITANVDPRKLGRVQVEVPLVLGAGTKSWAMPCVPYAGPGVGLVMTPPVGANIWVEFEAGDSNHPIWAGCFWGEGELPADPPAPELKLLKTEGVRVALDDKSGVLLEVTPPAASAPLKIQVGKADIEVVNQNASIKLSAAAVSVNNGALEVT